MRTLRGRNLAIMTRLARAAVGASGLHNNVERERRFTMLRIAPWRARPIIVSTS
jgi:hypothetical protein